MAALYAEGSLMVALEAGRKAYEYAKAGTYDVHFRDAAAKAMLELNAVASPHDDGVFSLPLAETDDGLVTELGETLTACEATLPAAGTVGDSELGPETIGLVIKLFLLVRSLWQMWS